MPEKPRPQAAHERWPVTLAGFHWYEVPIRTGTEYDMVKEKELLSSKDFNELQKLVNGRQFNIFMGFTVAGSTKEPNPLHFGSYGEIYKVMREGFRRWDHKDKLKTAALELRYEF